MGGEASFQGRATPGRRDYPLISATGLQHRFKVDDRMHLWLLAQPGDAAADIRLRLQVNAGAGLQHVGSPRVLALFGEESSIQWSGDAGATYRIVLRPVPVPLPSSRS